MSSSRLLLVGALVATAMATGWWLRGDKSHGNSMSPPKQAASIDNIGSGIPSRDIAVAVIQERLKALEAQVAAQQSTAAPKGSAPATNPASREIRQTELEARELRRLEAVDARFASEPRDRAWATPTENALRQSIAASGERVKGLMIDTLSCRTSLCKAEFSHATMDGFQALTEVFATVQGMAAYHFSNPTPAQDGGLSISAQFFRQGYGIPGEAPTRVTR